MIHLVVAILIVTFYGAGNPPHQEVALFASPEACVAMKLAMEKRLNGDAKVAGYSFTCAPVAIKQPGTLS